LSIISVVDSISYILVYCRYNNRKNKLNLKTVVFVLYISFLYVKTADDKLSIMDGDNKA